MMKRILVLLTALISAACLGVEINVNGNFKNLDSNGMPYWWMRNQWSGYNNPPCDIEIIQGGGLDGNSFHVSNVQSASGSGINTKFYPGTCGDVLRISFRARGTGNADIHLYFRTVTDEWNFQSPQIEKFKLTGEWRNYMFNLKVLNGAAGETGSFDIALHVEKDGELEMSDFKVNQIPGEYLGSEPFPQQWTLFGPFDRDYTPTADELTSMPETLNGVEGRTFRLDSNTLDFAKFFGPGERKCGWAFAVLDSPIDCAYSIGAGADWWMQVFVNGGIVIDTMDSGNGDGNYSIWNHIGETRLVKGTNIIAAKIVTGSASSILKIGGPLDLAAKDIKLKLSKMEWIESFDGETISCTGNPEIIVDIPTPGLLTPTGQAVFRTTGKVTIDQPVGAFAFPSDPNTYRAIGVRVQKIANDSTGELSMTLDGIGSNIKLLLRREAGSDQISMTASMDGDVLDSTLLDVSSLPYDILFGINKSGKFAAIATSLSAGTQTYFSGDTTFAMSNEIVTPRLEWESIGGSESTLVIDNYLVGLALPQGAAIQIPYIVEPDRNFDPVAAGWPLIFEDNFDGDTLDQTKWMYSTWGCHIPFVTVHDGTLDIKCDWDEDHTKLVTGHIKTREFYKYGYFEARCKFRKSSGWWSAFWLYGDQNANPFYDGFEIDIFEDYYLGYRGPERPATHKMDFNLHVYSGETLKSWNFNSEPGNYLDGFHTVAVKWTPFEITYYLDGKIAKSSANHSPYDTATFDAFYHSAGFSPLRAILSGQPRSNTGGDPKYGTFPESFYTDYVRIYAMPEPENGLKIDWAEKPENSSANYGDTLHFSADVQEGDSDILAVYLFDSGYLIDYKTEPPYNFDVILTKEFYDSTFYVRPGRQNIIPDFSQNIHAYAIYVQDKAGNVVHTEPYLLARIVNDSCKKSTPYQGTPQEIPGTVALADYDEGGQGVAYYDTTPGNNSASKHERESDVDVSKDGTIGHIAAGEWINYTVNVREAGRYKVTLPYGTATAQHRPVKLFLDFQPNEIASFDIFGFGQQHYALDKSSNAIVELPAGRHVLTLNFLVGLNVKELIFEKID